MSLWFSKHLCPLFPAGSATSISWLTSGCTRKLRSKRQLLFVASAASLTTSGCTCSPRPRFSAWSLETMLRLIWMTSSKWYFQSIQGGSQLPPGDVASGRGELFMEMWWDGLRSWSLWCSSSSPENTPSTMGGFTAATVSSSGCGTSCPVTSLLKRGLCS